MSVKEDATMMSTVGSRITALGLSLLVTAAVLPVHATEAQRIISPPFPYTVTNLTRIAQLIGATPNSPHAKDDPSPDSINDTTRWGICDGDLGSLLYAHGTVYVTLGDNFTTCPPDTGGNPMVGPPDWRSNAVGVVTNPADFKNGLHITRWLSRDNTQAMEVIPSEHGAGDCENTRTSGCEVTKIPTYGFTARDENHLFLAFMSVHHWGNPGYWDVNYSSFSMSSDRGKTWTVETPRITWGPHSNFAQVAVTPDADGAHLLFYGIPGGRFGSARLMRVPNTWQAVLNPRAYQYFTGTDAAGQPRWSNNPSRAVVVADAPVGELSVIYDPGLKTWLMTYLQGGGDLVIRSAPHYWGPWSRPATLAYQTYYPALYGAFMNPHFLTDSGHTVYFVMSQFGPYRIFWMKATLSRQ